MSWREAHDLAGSCAAALPAVRVPVGAAAGRLLAQSVAARCDLPAFDASAMDGWAVCGPGPWEVVGEVLAGSAAPVALRRGEAVWVATGARVPRGAESVLPLEQGTELDGSVHGTSEAGRHVRRRGEEVGEGEVLLVPGSLLSPAAVGLAAAVGHDDLLVVPKPRVLALVTGSELLDAGLPTGGLVRDALGPVLPSLVESHGGTCTVVRVPDGEHALHDAVVGADADVVLVSGSSSVGRADVLGPVLRALGADVLVDGVDVRPGHPMLLAWLPRGCWLVGLPGNPLAALASYLTLAAPLLARLGGQEPAPPVRVALDHERVAGTRLVPVRLVDGRAVPTGHGGSAMLRGAALADGLAVVEPGARGLVDVLPLRT